MPAKPGRAAQKSGTQAAKRSTSSKKSQPIDIDIDAMMSPTGMAEELARSAGLLADGLESGKYREPLERNLKAWVAIKALVNRGNGSVDPELRDRLNSVADMVAQTTFTAASSSENILPLINIDLELAKLIQSAVVHQMTQDRAYYLWQEAGCPHGNDQEYWFTARREIEAAQATVK